MIINNFISDDIPVFNVSKKPSPFFLYNNPIIKEMTITPINNVYIIIN